MEPLSPPPSTEKWLSYPTAENCYLEEMPVDTSRVVSSIASTAEVRGSVFAAQAYEPPPPLLPWMPGQGPKRNAKEKPASASSSVSKITGKRKKADESLPPLRDKSVTGRSGDGKPGYAHLNEKYKIVHSKLQMAKEQEVALIVESDTLRTKNNLLATQKKQLRLQNQTLRNRCTVFEIEKVQLEERVSRMETLEACVRNLEARNTALTAENTILTNSLQASIITNHQAQRELMCLNALLEQAKTTSATWESKYEVLKAFLFNVARTQQR